MDLESRRRPGHGPGGGPGPGPGGGHGHGPGEGHQHGPGDRHGHGSGSGNGPGPGDGHGRGDGHGSGTGTDGQSHSHSHGPATPVSKHLRKVIAAILIPFAAAVVVGLAVLWPGGAPSHAAHRRRLRPGRPSRPRSPRSTRSSRKSVNASGRPRPATRPPPRAPPRSNRRRATAKATIRIDTGRDKGRTFTEIIQPDQSRQLHEGEKVVAAYEPSAPEDLQYSVTDVNRKFPMALLAGIFALTVVVVGRMRGVMALVALAISFVILTFFILPAILQGSNPLVVAVVGASAIMLIALYMRRRPLGRYVGGGARHPALPGADRHPRLGVHRLGRR